MKSLYDYSIVSNSDLFKSRYNRNDINKFYGNCESTVTFNEFINYVTQHPPKRFQLWIYVDYQDIGKSYEMWDFVKIKGGYQVNNILLRETELFNLILDTHQYTFKDFSIFLNSLYQQLQIIEIRYDLYTIRNIYRYRYECQHYNSIYNSQMTLIYLNLIDIPDIVDVSSFIRYMANYIYLLFSLSILIRQDTINIMKSQFYINQVSDEFITQYVNKYNINTVMDDLRLVLSNMESQEPSMLTYLNK